MKIALLNDTHFGCRNDSPAFIEYQNKFYEEMFFPYLKRHDIKTLIHRCGMTNTAIPAVAKRCHHWIFGFHPYFHWTTNAFWSSNLLISARITLPGELWVIVRIIRLKHRNLLFLNQVRECRWRTFIVSQMIFRQRETKSRNVLKYNSTFCDDFPLWDGIGHPRCRTLYCQPRTQIRCLDN